jgi:sugar O-acyltransferase (sialic acid O-acetyltransferase NeuD family)
LIVQPLVIFGAGDMAELAHFYFSHDSRFRVAAFTVDRAYVRSDSVCGLPVVPFDEVVARFPPAEFALFVAVGYSRVNAVRQQKYAAARSLGYRMASYLSARATAWPGFVLRENCFILEDVTLQPFSEVGENVTVWSGAHVGHHSRIGNHSFLAPHVAVAGYATIGERCFLGVNSTIRDHVRIGDRCVIGAGAVILSDAEADGVFACSATERSGRPSSELKKI